jgi:hypothetical protein
MCCLVFRYISNFKAMDVYFLTPSECSIRNVHAPAVIIGHLDDYEGFQALGVHADMYVRLSAHTEILAPLLALADNAYIVIHRSHHPPIRVEHVDRQPLPNIDIMLDEALCALDPAQPVLEQVLRSCRLHVSRWGYMQSNVHHVNQLII